MDTVSNYLKRLQKYVNELDVVIGGGKRSMLSRGMVQVDEETVNNIMSDIKNTLEDLANDLPSEISDARRAVMESDKLIAEARERAKGILIEAEQQAEIIVSEHEVVRAAQTQYENVTMEARKYAHTMRSAANTYYQGAVDILENVVRNVAENFTRNAAEGKRKIEGTLESVREMQQQLDAYVKSENDKYNKM